MANELDIKVRRAAIAALIANPYERTPTKEALAQQFGVDQRTIYRDFESDEVQDAVQDVIGAYAKSDGLSAAFKVVLATIAGGSEVSKKEQLETSKWLLERVGKHFSTKFEHFLQAIEAPADAIPLSEIDLDIEEKVKTVRYVEMKALPESSESGNGSDDDSDGASP